MFVPEFYQVLFFEVLYRHFLYSAFVLELNLPGKNRSAVGQMLSSTKT